MVDKFSQLQHRPRTSRALSNRLIEAAEAAGAESPTFHEALRAATAYLEIATGSPRCPNCGATLNGGGMQQGVHRYDCYSCSWSPTFSRVLGIDDPEIQPP